MSKLRSRCVWFGALAVAAASAGPAQALPWPSAITAIEQGLSSDEVETRRASAAELGGLPQSVAHRLLAAALGDADAVVRVHAVDAAIATRYAAVAERVGSWFSDKDATVRLAAARALTAFPERNTSVQRLARALGDPEASVRLAVAGALGESSNPEATPALLARLDDSDLRVAIGIVQALERLGDPRSAVPLISKLSDNRAKLRRAVVVALGSMGGGAAVNALTLALRDADRQVRLAAVSSLGRTREAAAVEPLRGVIASESDTDLRVAALTALAEVPDPRTTVVLIELLDAAHAEVAGEAAQLLRDAPLFDTAALERCLEEQPSRARADGCARALAARGGETAFDAITRAWRARKVSTLAALEAHGDLADPRATTDVLEQLSARDPRVRVAAVDAARRLLSESAPDGRAVEPIRHALAAAKELQERVALIDLLGRTGSPRAAQTLTGAVDAALPVQLRLAALRALGGLGHLDSDAARAALTSLSDAHGAIRFEAAHALRRVGSDELLPELFERLDTRAGQDRMAVALALSGPLSQATDARWAPRVLAAMKLADAPLADALTEALAHLGGQATTDALIEVAGRGLESRAKVAEMLALRRSPGEHRKAREFLERSLADAAPSVRANAAWSLGSIGEASSEGVLTSAIGDPDVAVSANAIAALGRLGLAARAHSALCTALDDPRAYTRANALVALRLASLRCVSGSERWLLERDPSEVVRARAARLLTTVKSQDVDADRTALDRCARGDASGRVASACLEAAPPSGGPSQSDSAGSGLTVYIVPAGRTAPLPGAPYALAWADGMLRLGLADRRGVAFAAGASAGELTLEVPAHSLR